MLKEEKLSKNNIQSIMSLTSLQQGMLFHYINDIDNDTNNMYHEQLNLTIKGDIKFNLLQQAWQYVIDSNEMLRTVFRWKGIDNPVQIVLKKHDISIKYLDFTTHNNKKDAIKQLELNDLSNKIDITSETLRIYLCKLNDDTHKMIVSNHHMLYDGWSNGIILKEVMQSYNCLYDGKQPKAITKNSFNNFIKYLNDIDKEKQEEYWTNHLVNLDNKDDYFACKELGTYKQITYSISETKSNEIRRFAVENNVLLSSILYSAWAILLQKFSNNDDVVFGSTVSGRPESISEIDKMVGLFINTIPLRVNTSDVTTLIELIRGVDDNLSKRKEYENASLIDIKEYCGLKTNEKLFDSIVTIENYPLDFNLNKENILKIEAYSITEHTNYNMSLEILAFNEITFTFDFNSLAIDEKVVDKFGAYLEIILDNISLNQKSLIKDIELISITEKNQLLYEFNDTKSLYPIEKTIQELFEEQVRKTPNNIAVVFGDEELTYNELNEKSNRVAKLLQDNGVNTDTIVGLMVEKSLEMIIGILAILKSGGAYLPIDLSYPKDRIEYMLKDSNTKIMLCQSHQAEDIEFSGHVINFSSEEISKYNSDNLNMSYEPNNLAYVIYTSGTTGLPKGVMIENRNLVAYVYAFLDEFKLNEHDSVLQQATYCFDGFVDEVYPALLVGGKFVICSKYDALDINILEEIVCKNNISVVSCSPLFLNELNKSDKLKSIHTFISGGDVLKYTYYNNLTYARVYNTYGPTEATVCATYYKCKDNETNIIPIGKPINNYQVYILDKNKKIVPIGVDGELYIAGDGISRGYINRPELTAEKFVQNPILPGTIMYKTGDLARWTPDGNIVFRGRIDNQVKIRGFRIEIEEIENRLLKHENVKETIVLAKDNVNGEKYICAYIVSDKKLQDLNLKKYLKETMPEYMIPAYFIELEKIPRTINGKLDKSALPEPNIQIDLTNYEAPRNKLEETLVKIWSEVLGVKSIGINDNFFDLGGHSLKATMLISKIHKQLNKEVPLKELFIAPTVKELSQYIDSIEENPYSNITKTEQKEYYETSSAQKRMYMLQQFDKDSVAYNMAVAFELIGQINKDRLEKTIKNLIQRHEALRTSFETINEEIVQKIHDDLSYELKFTHKEGNLQQIIHDFIRPFDLEKGPLFRTELVENKEKTYLLIDMHHIISDGLSVNILVKEFTQIYNGNTLKPLKLQYKDFAAWQNSFLKSDDIKKQEQYWINQFSDERPVLNMPIDYRRPIIQSFDGEVLNFEIDKDTTSKIQALTRKTGTTVHMVLLSAFSILLSKYNGQEDIIIGTPIAGRLHADLQNIMGMFVNTLALRTRPNGNMTYKEFLNDVKNNSLLAYENQSYQFEELVEKLNIRKDTSRNPIFDVMFNMIDEESSKEIILDDIVMKSCFEEKGVSKFDISLDATEIKNKINLSVEYCIKIFKKDTIERLINRFIRILKTILNNISIRLDEIDILTETEKKQLLYDFNNTKVEFPRNKTIQQIFEEQVEKTPNKLAVVYEKNQITYKELNEKANALANTLRKMGITREKIVGIMLDRSINVIVAILATIKSGGAYLPIDTSHPRNRVNYILTNSNANILITETKYLDDLNFSYNTIDINDISLYLGDTENLNIINDKNDLLYVLYTSGTTGNPKGVMVEQKNLINMVYSWIEHYKLDEFSVNLLQLASVAFDVFTGDLCRSLLTGGTMYICPNEVRIDMKRLYSTINKFNINILESTPSLIITFMNYVDENNLSLSSIKLLILGSDSCPIADYKKLVKQYGKDMRILNSYGITEATIDTSYYEETIDNIPLELVNTPIGKPLSNSKFYILNKALCLQPIGIVGELYVGGAGVTRGYYNNPDMTTSKFIDNPYEKGEKIYKTGDIARWLSDGNVEFLGRSDNQVKIRGFRIELSEIENKLLQNENVKEAVVLVKENQRKEKYICAYVVIKEELEKLSLKEYLSQSLPNYMVPNIFIELEQIPLTLNGKVNRRNLPEPNFDIISNVYEAPTNEIEDMLCNIWSEVLGVEKVGINDNFFDLGGHSLNASILVSRIFKELNKDIPLKKLFISPTIKELSKYIIDIEDNPYSKIEKIKKSEYYQASSAQKRMYILQQFDNESIAYNMSQVFEINGNVDINKLEQAFQQLIKRHEALRTYFDIIDDNIVQKILDNYVFKLKYTKTNENIDNITNKFIQPFNLKVAPLFRVELIENNEKLYLLIDMHHIISDGLSTNILIKDFINVYNENTLLKLKLQYKDFATWQNDYLKSEDVKKQETYWTDIFKDEIPVLNLPTDYERPKIQSYDGDKIDFLINEDTTDNLRQLVKETGTTMHMVLLSTFFILLSKYSGQEDIIVGTPIAGRLHAELDGIMGMFVNTLALRNKPNGNKKYIDFLSEVKKNALDAYDNQSYQFEELVEKLNVAKDKSRNPLFDVMFNMLDSKTYENIELNGFVLKPYIGQNKVSKFDITLNVLEKDKTLNLELEYCKKLYKNETMERLVHHYVNILSSVLDNRNIKLDEIDLTTEEEKNKILYEFNNTKVVYPKDKTVQELFEEQVEKTPDKIAISFENNRLTYKELNEKSNSLARILRQKGAKQDSLIGIMLEKSLEMIIGILAILKSGGAYLPIDYSYPKERIEFMLKDSDTKIILSQQYLMDNISFDGEVVDVSDKGIYEDNTANLDIINSSNDLAYVIYTSGTTGEPKGVMCEHKNIVRLVKNTNYIEFKEYDKILQTGSMVFDASTFELWGAMLNGLELYLAKSDIIISPNGLENFINKNNITILWLTSALFSQIAEENISTFKNLRYLLVGGDVLSPKYINLVRKQYKNLNIINGYGPTENTTFSTTYRIKDDNNTNIPIGKPISNSTAYILDKNYTISPIGIYNELYVGGDGVARGYLNRAELTAEKFIDNPYEAGTKMYKTGDLARWLLDGNIEFLGRIDNQVKIRGFRIELDEIENNLLQHESVKKSVVIIKENDNKEKYICAYVVVSQNLQELNLRKFLGESLPEYMIPSCFIELEQIPLTLNGKVDKRALPDPDFKSMSNEYEAPKSFVEKTLVNIWSEVLGINNISINDNFFDLGGHSLKAILIISKIHKALNKEIPLKVIFESLTIKELAKQIECAEENVYQFIEKVEEKEYYETSSAQKRMFILQQIDIDSTAYNLPVAFKIEEKLNREKIEETIRLLVKRHESLRTSFEQIDGAIVQKIHNDYQFNLDYVHDNLNIGEIIRKFIRPFDLSKSPLIRAQLVESSDNNYLLIDMHHIISDGVSVNVLIKEFSDIYSGKVVEPLKLQYKDFAAWQNAFIESDNMKKQEEFWVDKFSGEIPSIKLPVDYENNYMQSFDGDNVDFDICGDTTIKLKKLINETGTTMHMVMLSVFTILLSKYSEQEDIIVGTPIAGRNHSDLDNIIGMFVNTLALRNEPKGNKTYINYLNETKENLLVAYDNQSYQFETLVDKLGIKDKRKNPLFDVFFAWNENPVNQICIEDTRLTSLHISEKISKFDLTFSGYEDDSIIKCSFEYRTQLFNKDTIELMGERLKIIIDDIVSNREILIKDIDWKTDFEKQISVADDFEFNF